MARNLRPGSIHDAIRRAVVAAGGVEAAAADLECGIARVSGWSDPEAENGRRMALADAARLARMHPAVAEVLARHFAALAGGAYAPPDPEAGTVSGACATLSRSAAEAASALMLALDEGGPGGAEVTEEERRRIGRAADEAYNAARALLTRLQLAERRDG